jgi:hypothetical protein
LKEYCVRFLKSQGNLPWLFWFLGFGKDEDVKNQEKF